MSGLCLLLLIFPPVFAADTDSPDGDTENTDITVVSFTPDWRTFFYNETITISCLQSPKAPEDETYTWYRNNVQMDVHAQNFTISSIQLYHRANYQCKTSSSVKSDPVLPLVITDLSVLRVPRYVFEGDILNLTCDSRLDVNTTKAQVSFFKNSKVQRIMTMEPYLFIGQVDKSLEGKYSCTKKAIQNNEEKQTNADNFIAVTALFSTPEIKLSSYPISLGMDMTLTCETSLHPLRADTELQFAFYRNGWHVQGFGSSNKYKVQSITVEDSGDYSCEVRTIMNSVRKMSKQLPILIPELSKPLLSTYPKVDKVFRYNMVIMTCNDPKSKTFSWYKDNVKIFSNRKTVTINAYSDKDIGYYQCQGESGEKSDPLHLDVYFVWLILQIPPHIHEGDKVTLQCSMWKSGSAVNTTFYKDDNMIKFLGSETDLDLGIVSKNATGKYKCTRFINTGSSSKTYVAEGYVSVAELFTSPEIRLNLHPVVEGADMTLTCHTTRSPFRYSITLAFAFYKNGKIVQDFSKSSRYKILSAQLEDSGSYTCEVKASSATVKKMSEAVSIDVQGMAVVTFTPNVGKILTTENMTLTCNVDPKIKDKQEYSWYKDGIRMDRTHQSFTIQDAGVSDSGYYQCRSTNTHMSEPLRLDVCNGDLVIQAPPFILEGDDLLLDCRHRQSQQLHQTQFYKDDKLLKIMDSSSVLAQGRADPSMTGTYRCQKKAVATNYLYKDYAAELFVPVTEIFTYLVLKVISASTVEGTAITLSCNVALNPVLNPLRGSTKLEFAFYKDGNSIRDFSTSSTYEMASAMVKDSGNYTCNVKYLLRGLVRSSPEVEINVEESFSTPVLSVSPTFIRQGKPLTLTCDFTIHPDVADDTIRPVIYKNGKVYSNSRTFRINAAQTYISAEYRCSANNYNRQIIKYSETRYILVEERMDGAKISVDQQDANMLVGSNTTFTCSVHEGTPISFTWLHNGKEIAKNCALYNIRQDGRVLYIEALQQEHSGVYRCNVSNHFSSSMSDELKITVIEPPGGAFLLTDLKEIDLMPEDSVKLTCSLTQGNGSNFFWLHNDQNLKQDTATYEFREGGKVLHIKSAQPYHEGSYQCGVEKDIPSGRPLVSKSGIWTLKISSKGGSYLKPFLIVLVVVLIILIIVIAYKYQNKIFKPHFLQGKLHNIRVPLVNIEDKAVLVENAENFERISSPPN
ncbi:hypothetical protein GDO81_014839 [Engystomops pustulosus]|uniref:Ig-like domain-containing protein n=1 Tax=Engystomops pustulosus TaxID=76066 RepID=A0AAV7AHC1_ENGPU|nr:hypothetical protein GDO81_014839 [Engystomops pustulosus]